MPPDSCCACCAADLSLHAERGALTLCRWADGVSDDESELVARARRQLAEYLAGHRRTFDIPLRPAGTPLQRRVWQAVAGIPYGHRATYADIAARIGAPRAVRAVARALAANPLVIFIPCHRVVRSDGTPGGYNGGAPRKVRLLEMEVGNGGRCQSS